MYLANDPLLNRQVAIKIPRLEILADQGLRQRFVNEAKIAAALDHPGIVPVFEIGDTEIGFYIVSLYCPGMNLGQWLAAHPNQLALEQIVDLVECLAEALQYCHTKDVLHRDLKPSNVLLFPVPYRSLPFTPRLTDFGLAKVMQSSLMDTTSSVLLGTPMYMAPEQAWSRSDDLYASTDIYSLGAMFYELLIGKPPFHATSLALILDQVRNAEPTALRKLNPNLPRDLETICLKCLRKSPKDRYLTAEALLLDLRAYKVGAIIAARPFNGLDRFLQWTERPERIPQAAMVSFVIAFVSSLPVVSGLWLSLSGRLTNVDVQQVVGGLCQIALCFCLPHVILGCFTLRRSKLAIMVGTILPLLMSIYITGLIFGVVDTGGYLGNNDANQSLTISLEMLGLGLLVTELFCYFAAYRALRSVNAS